MAKIKLLDEWADGCGCNAEFTVPIPTEVQSVLSNAIEQTIKSSVRYSSISLTDEQKQEEIKSAYEIESKKHQANLSQRFKMYGTEIEVK